MRSGITYDQVAAAAEKLVAEGKSPTIRALRDILGTGSPNTIHRHLSCWKAASAKAGELSKIGEGSEAQIAAMAEQMEAVTKARDEAQAAADERAAEIKRLRSELDAAQLAQVRAERKAEAVTKKFEVKIAIAREEAESQTKRADWLARRLSISEGRIEEMGRTIRRYVVNRGSEQETATQAARTGDLQKPLDPK